MFDDITKYLNNLNLDYKLYVNLTQGHYDNDVITKIKEFKSDSVIVVNKNKGVDIGGFLNLLELIDDDTDLVLKLHTKRGSGSEETPSYAIQRHGKEAALKQAYNWHHNLMKGVLRDVQFVNSVIEKFKTDSNCGMIGFKLYKGVGLNQKVLNDVIPVLGLSKKVLDYNFIGGTMFWVRYDILKKYFTKNNIKFLLNLLPENYTLEPSLNHALERIFGYIVQNENKEICVLN